MDNNNNNLDDVKIMLALWGDWYFKSSRLPNLGFPKSVPFIWQRVDGVRQDSAAYVEEFGASEAIPLLIHQALSQNRFLLKIAEVSYIYGKEYGYKDRANILIKRYPLIYLGSSNDSRRKKYQELEAQLHYFIYGFTQAYHILLPES